MHETTLAKRYALALADLAAERNRLEETGQELDYFQEVLAATRDFHLLLTNPTSSQEEQGGVLELLLNQASADPSASLDPLTANFLRLLVSKRRMSLIGHITQAYHRELERRSGRITVRVATPMSLTQVLANRLLGVLTQLTGKTVNMVREENPDLLGGAVIRVESLMLDYSVRSKLNRLQAQLKG